MALQFPTRAERPGHLPHTASLRERAWPEFMYHDPVLERLFGRVIAEDAEFQFYAWDDEREEVVGVGMAVPASWDGDAASLPDGGLDAVVEARFAGASSEADRALRDADPDRARVPGPGSEHSHDPADDRDPSRPRPRHADRSGPADPKALVPARSAGAIHQLAPPGQDSPRPMAKDARATRSRDREGRAAIDEHPGLGRRMGGMGADDVSRDRRHGVGRLPASS